jgi:hypothetical protein
MVVPVLITSCQVSEKSNNGPVIAHTTTIPRARAKTHARPASRDVAVASFENGFGDACWPAVGRWGAIGFWRPFLLRVFRISEAKMVASPSQPTFRLHAGSSPPRRERYANASARRAHPRRSDRTASRSRAPRKRASWTSVRGSKPDLVAGLRASPGTHSLSRHNQTKGRPGAKPDGPWDELPVHPVPFIICGSNPQRCRRFRASCPNDALTGGLFG